MFHTLDDQHFVYEMTCPAKMLGLPPQVRAMSKVSCTAKPRRLVQPRHRPLTHRPRPPAALVQPRHEPRAATRRACQHEPPVLHQGPSREQYGQHLHPSSGIKLGRSSWIKRRRRRRRRGEDGGAGGRTGGTPSGSRLIPRGTIGDARRPGWPETVPYLPV